MNADCRDYREREHDKIRDQLGYASSPSRDCVSRRKLRGKIETFYMSTRNRYHLLFLGAVLLLGALPAAGQTGRDRPLFDGKTLKGWEAHGDAEDWSAENGTLACKATKAGWLSTVDTFSDYVLRIEFRGSEKVNSGIFLRSQKEGQPHITGYELQIWDYQPAGYNTGSLVNSVKAEPTKIQGDKWNQYEIRAEGDHFVVTLNGAKILDAHDAKHSAGVIGLQCQPNNPIAFRNISIRELKH